MNICKENFTSAKGILAKTISLHLGRSWNRYENGTAHNTETQKSINDVCANFIDFAFHDSKEYHPR